MPRGHKGEARTPGSGRKKGTPNKNRAGFQDILDAFEDGKGFEPLKEMLTLYTLIYADNPLIAFNILKTILDRQVPALKAIEHSGEIKNPYLDKSYEELKTLAREILKDDK